MLPLPWGGLPGWPSLTDDAMHTAYWHSSIGAGKMDRIELSLIVQLQLDKLFVQFPYCRSPKLMTQPAESHMRPGAQQCSVFGFLVKCQKYEPSVHGWRSMFDLVGHDLGKPVVRHGLLRDRILDGFPNIWFSKQNRTPFEVSDYKVCNKWKLYPMPYKTLFNSLKILTVTQKILSTGFWTKFHFILHRHNILRSFYILKSMHLKRTLNLTYWNGKQWSLF